MQFRKILSLVILGMLPALSGAADAASLEVYVSNLRPTKTVQVSVFKDAQTWAKGREPVAQRVVLARDITQTIRIDNLPPGRYAVRVHQDPNHLGSVIEPPSFALERNGSSGNRMSHNGVPQFERAALEVGAGGARSSIRLVAASHY